MPFLLAIPAGEALAYLGGATLLAIGWYMPGGGRDAAEKALSGHSDPVVSMSPAQQSANAQTQAQAQAGTSAASITCAQCSQNPCAALATGVPGSPYRGGVHGAMTQPTGDGKDSHHTPAAAASYLARPVGPAIQMDPADHYDTASNGRQPGSAQYIATQTSLVNNGNFMAAVAMDVADIHAKFGTKYDGALAQMMAYAECLKNNNVIK